MDSHSVDEPDIAILLAQTWGVRPGEPIGHDEICRMWAYDLGWFEMQVATRVRDNLIEAGWLEVRPEGLRPMIDISVVQAPFAWMPVMRVLEDPPRLAQGATPVPAPETPAEPEVIVEPAMIDPAAQHITTLLDRIAQESNLDRKEVMRRAQRKRRALGPVTLWMALLLVAREQQLSMPGLVASIAA